MGACWGLRERAFVLVVVIVIVVAVSGLVLYAMHRSKPSRLKLTASLLKLVSFSIEVESQDDRQRELPVKKDDLDSKAPGVGHVL
jgi:hypothetical protein